MTRSLPAHPSLRFLQEQAKDLLKAQRQKDSSSCGTLRLLRRFREATDEQIFSASLALNEVQFALAMDYGFASWAELREHVAQAVARAPRSYQHLDEVFRGHCMKADTFSLSMHAAAELLGRPVDYETVLAASSNPFSLALCPKENCTAWWHMYQRGVCMDFVGQALGLELRRLDLPTVGMEPNLPPDRLAEVTARTRREIGPILRREMEAGAVLITEGGWQVTGGRHGFIPWCHWGVVTAASDQELCGATLPGNSLQGHWDTPLEYVDTVYSVRIAGDAMDPSAARTEVLRLAAARIHGRSIPFRRDDVAFGLEGMDLWIRQMKQVKFFCEVCGDKGWRCAQSTANAAVSGAQAASAWLREQAGLEPAMAEPLTRAADAYGRISQRFGPALGKEGGYQQIAGDLARQDEHAQTVLLPIREDLAQAADAMEQAVAMA